MSTRSRKGAKDGMGRGTKSANPAVLDAANRLARGKDQKGDRRKLGEFLGDASFARVADAFSGRASKRTRGAPGVCRVCGCTDESGCDGGCEWVRADLCSRCVWADLGLNAEEAELALAAALAVRDTVRAARKSKRYRAYEWMEESTIEQMDHARLHTARAYRMLRGFKPPASWHKEPHAEHALCRLAIFLALKARGHGARAKA